MENTVVIVQVGVEWYAWIGHRKVSDRFWLEKLVVDRIIELEKRYGIVKIVDRFEFGIIDC